MKAFYRFTLMETIAVMVIIIVLISILMPLYVKSREVAKDIKCKSNLKGLGESVNSYANDWHGYGPKFWSGYSSPWTYLLQQGGYLTSNIKVNRGDPPSVIYNVTIVLGANQGNSNLPAQHPANYNNILACPAEKVAVPYNAAVASQLGYPAYNWNYRWVNGTHYDIHREVGAYLWVPQPIFSLGKLHNFQKMTMLGDGLNGNTGFYSTSGYSHLYWARHFGRSQNVSSTSISTNALGVFGNARANLIMMDGHTRSVTETDVWRENIWYKY